MKLGKHMNLFYLIKVSSDRSADSLLKHVIDVVNRFELKDKLVIRFMTEQPL